MKSASKNCHVTFGPASVTNTSDEPPLLKSAISHKCAQIHEDALVPLRKGVTTALVVRPESSLPSTAAACVPFSV